MKLEGRIALVTGAGSGIGQAIAVLFAREGADIAITVIADVSNAQEVGAMVSRTIEKFGAAHILVNNAGVPHFGLLIEDQTAEQWDRVIAVTLRGTYLCSRRVGQWMASHGGGKIVNISSVAGLVGSPSLAGYGAAKAGVINLTRSLAADWGKYKINVNAIAAGLIDTPLTRRTIAGSWTPDRIGQEIPLGRMGTAEDVANAALFLVSEEANYITGVTLPVDGGRLA